MAYGRKLLLSNNNSTTNATPADVAHLETEFVVVVAALVCAIISVVGLLVVARCAFLRRGADRLSFSFGMGNKGVKKKVLNSLPKYTHKSEEEGVSDCVICLAEYCDGDEIRVLPQCGHRFHLHCINTWLASNSSCPSCRQILVVTRCQNCGEFPTLTQDAAAKLTPFSSPASTSSITVLP